LVIIGLGGVGFAALRLAEVVTNASLVVVDIDDATLRAAAAAATGAVVIDARDKDVDRQIRVATGGGAYAVLDFVGGETSVALGLKSLAIGGLLVVVGLFGGQLQMSLPLWPLRSLTLQGSYVGSLADMRDLMALVRQGDVPGIPVRARPLADVQLVLNELGDGAAVGRMVLTP
jgi:propanol-preferring alcohol dehydrogenase